MMRYEDFDGKIEELILIKIREIEEKENIKVLLQLSREAEPGDLLRRIVTMMYGLYMYAIKTFIYPSARTRTL